ncbi:MAG: FAD-binding domain-containing protein [Deinococcota bacterium]
MLLDPTSLTLDTFTQTFAGYATGEMHTSPVFEPTLAAAKQMLASYNPKTYAKTRNHVEGNVSRLNPYITWGVFTLTEVQRAVKAKLLAHSKDYQKFVSELAWKAFFREGFMALGERVYDSLEPYKYPTNKRDELPEAVGQGSTGLTCIDSIVHELKETGYLHNHKRMWFAAYLVHFENVEWWHGEQLFYRYLLDGEPGANALSWQWVASTFAGKPYYFNGDNMRRYGHEPCEDAPFNTSYEDLNQSVFSGYGQGGYTKRPKEQPFTDGLPPHPRLLRAAGDAPLVLLHAERLSDEAEVLNACPDVPVVVWLDSERFKDEQPSWMRLHFAVSLAADLAKILEQQGRQVALSFSGDFEDVLTCAAQWNCKSLAAADSWHPDTWSYLDELDELLPVSVIEDEPFARAATSLRSFSSYWRAVEREVMRR